MASPQQFIAKSGQSQRHIPTPSKAIQWLQNDAVQLRYMNCPLKASAHIDKHFKKRQQPKPGSRFLFTGVKDAGKSSKDEKIHQLALRASQKEIDSLLFKTKPSSPQLPPAGFRYHSNGDERLSSSSCATSSAVSLAHLLRNSSQTSSQNLSQHGIASRRSSGLLTMERKLSEEGLQRQMSKHQPVLPAPDLALRIARLPSDFRLRRVGTSSTKSLAKINYLEPRGNWTNRSSALTLAPSTFNKRYGVSLKLLAQRRAILDSIKQFQTEEVALVDAQVEDYEKRVEELNGKKLIKKRETEMERNLSYPARHGTAETAPPLDVPSALDESVTSLELELGDWLSETEA